MLTYLLQFVYGSSTYKLSARTWVLDIWNSYDGNARLISLVLCLVRFHFRLSWECASKLQSLVCISNSWTSARPSIPPSVVFLFSMICFSVIHVTIQGASIAVYFQFFMALTSFYRRLGCPHWNGTNENSKESTNKKQDVSCKQDSKLSTHISIFQLKGKVWQVHCKELNEHLVKRTPRQKVDKHLSPHL